jgi:hypothetical protein
MAPLLLLLLSLQLSSSSILALAAPTNNRISWINECFHAGNEASWEMARRYQAELIHKGGTIVDLSCCNGIALHDLRRWSGKDLVPYGSDINSMVLHAWRLFPDYHHRGKDEEQDDEQDDEQDEEKDEKYDKQDKKQDEKQDEKHDEKQESHFVNMDILDYISGHHRRMSPQGWPETFDFVHLNLSFHHLSPTAFFTDLVLPLLGRVSSGGRLLISFYPHRTVDGTRGRKAAIDKIDFIFDKARGMENIESFFHRSARDLYPELMIADDVWQTICLQVK